MLEINKLELADVYRIVELEEELLGESLGIDMLTEEIKRGVVTFLKASVGDKTIGYIGGYAFDGELEIINFVVDKAYQRQGIGTKLLNEIMEITSAKRIILDVRDTNIQGINFYTKNGFTPVNIRKNYYKNGDNAVVMERRIK